MFSALLDACALVPSLKRDVLLEIGSRRVYRPLWSSEILGEVSRAIVRINNKLGKPSDVTGSYVRRLLAQMDRAFPDALVSEWERLVPTIELPDKNDRHVVAAAVVGRADVIVTDNRKDFPTEQLPTPLFTQTVDTFLLDSYDLQPALVIAAVKTVAARTGRKGKERSPRDIAELLGARGCPEFAKALLECLDAGTDD